MRRIRFIMMFVVVMTLVGLVSLEINTHSAYALSEKKEKKIKVPKRNSSKSRGYWTHFKQKPGSRNVTTTLTKKGLPGNRPKVVPTKPTDNSGCTHRRVSTQEFDRGEMTYSVEPVNYIYYDANGQPQLGSGRETIEFEKSYPGLDLDTFISGAYPVSPKDKKYVYHYYVISCPKNGYTTYQTYKVRTPRNMQKHIQATLAQTVTKTLNLPKPSGGLSVRPWGDPREFDFTLVNAWLWFWTDPVSMQVQDQTINVGQYGVKVTATPVGLSFDPGDGKKAVWCNGPGTDPKRTSTQPDYYTRSPSRCDYMYKITTVRHRDRYPDGKMTATTTIRWRITWEGPEGTHGTLNDMDTHSTARFVVGETHNLVVG